VSEVIAPLKLRARMALAFQGACVTAVALYAVLRLVQSLLFSEPNPATVIWSAHAGYFWRAWTVSYAGIMACFVAFAAAKRYEVLVCRGLQVALYVASALILLQGLLVP
jgi:hypothetical protein